MSRKTSVAAALGLALALTAAPAFAFVPFLADKAAVVGEGAMVLTLDLANTAYEGPGDSTVLAATFDYGFNPTLDFRGFLPVWLDSPGDESGIGDITLGARWNFNKVDEWTLSLFPYLTLQTGDSDKGLGAGELNFGANFLASWSRNPWSLDINADLYTNNVKGGDNEMGWALLADGSYALQDNWSLLGGLEFVNDGNATADYLLVGAGYLVSQAVDLKAGLRLGLNDNGADSQLVLRAVFGL